MSIPEDRLQQLIRRKDSEEALRWCKEHHYSEGWAIVDGCLVIYNIDDKPSWLGDVLESRDEDGNTPEFQKEAAA